MVSTSCLLYMSYLLPGFSPNSAPAAGFIDESTSLSFFPETVYNYSHRSINPETRFFNPKLEMHTFESDYPFCSGLRCELHVRAGDTDVHGFGNWAHLPMGASLAAGYMTASFCATRAAARKSERRFEPKPKWRHDQTHLG
jgi:hypothetical protein